jgi:ribonuclease HI
MSSKGPLPGGNPSLFPEPSAVPAHQVQWFTANVDGGARGNPGPAGYGVYLRDASGAPIRQLSEYLGHKSNNVAEYSALLAALEYSVANGIRALKVISDSELMVKQMNGQYRVSSPDLKPLYERARSLVRQLDQFAIEHVLRGKNQHADRLANEAMDRGMGKK